ncbi:MAG: cytochrome c [Firmicutes bacterium]|nr:cytochrome c [Bacillota bacterium]
MTSDKNSVIDRIKNGGSSMPAFEGTLSDEQIDAIAEYVKTVIAPLGK